MAVALDPRDPGVRAERINDSFREAGYTREYIDFWWNELAFRELGSRTPTRAWLDLEYEAVEALAQALHDREPATRAWLEQMKRVSWTGRYCSGSRSRGHQGKSWKPGG